MLGRRRTHCPPKNDLKTSKSDRESVKKEDSVRKVTAMVKKDRFLIIMDGCSWAKKVVGFFTWWVKREERVLVYM